MISMRPESLGSDHKFRQLHMGSVSLLKKRQRSRAIFCRCTRRQLFSRRTPKSASLSVQQSPVCQTQPVTGSRSEVATCAPNRDYTRSILCRASTGSPPTRSLCLTALRLLPRQAIVAAAVSDLPRVWTDRVVQPVAVSSAS